MASRPIGDADYSTSSIQYKGVNYYQKEIIRSSSRKLINKGNISVEYKYTSLERGNYRFRAQLLESEIVGEQNSSKDFAVRSKNFPLLKTPHERAQSMAYLMDDKEHKELLSIKNSDSLQNAIDSFWYTNIGDITKAQNAKSQYFDRVLTANKEFTNFKEGWKTDQGMVFILFGNPWVIDKDFETKTWFYSYNRLDEDKTFEFFRTRVKNDSFPFKNYILERKFDYNNVLYKQKRLWFTGQILETQI
jgi:GWxTD domain-containing protein